MNEWQEWLAARTTTLLSERGGEAVGIAFGDEVTVGEVIVLPNGAGIRLTDLQVYSRGQVLDLLGSDAATRTTLEGALDLSQGEILLSAPTEQDQRTIAGFLLGITQNWNLALTDDSPKYGLTLRIGTANDPLTPLLQGDPSPFLLSLCGVTLPRPCLHCGKLEQVPRDLLQRLPAPFHEIPLEEQVPSGCAECNRTGIARRGAVLSALRVDGELRALLSSEASTETIFRRVHDRALRPLLEHALLRLAAGAVRLGDILTRVPLLGFPGIPWRPGSEVLRSEPLQSARDSEKPPILSPSAELVLLVEDDGDQREIMAMVLRSHGFEVRVAEDGVQALAALEQNIPALIITDLMMPRIDGQELVRRVRANPHYRSIPIVVLTVLSDQEREFSLLELGADDYCSKTVQPRVLLKRIDRLLLRSRGTSNLSAGVP
jgi:CheY-like chemotaxis protein